MPEKEKEKALGVVHPAREQGTAVLQSDFILHGAQRQQCDLIRGLTS